MTRDEKMDLEAMAEAYLDGLLAPDESTTFEEALLTEEGSEALSQALMFRYLMLELAPQEVESTLIDSIHAALMNELQQSEDSEALGILERIKGTLQIMGYAFHGPKAAWHSASHTTHGLKAASKGAETIGFSLGHLRQPTIAASKQVAQRKPSLWQVLRAPLKLL